MKKIFVINTGSTSTKIAIYHDNTNFLQENLIMPENELKEAKQAVDQLAFRSKEVQDWLEDNHYKVSDFDIIVARGGSLPPIKGGAYLVNQLMVDVLRYMPASGHESSLACMIGADIAMGTKVPVVIYDGVSVDEIKEVAKYTGFPGILNSGRGHILNSRRVSRLAAKKAGKKYEDSTSIVVHLGGSISVSAHEKGRIVDTVNAFTGPMSTQRAGRLPTDELVRLCYSGKYTQQELLKLLNGGSGYKGYFGTQDARKIAGLLDEGDGQARDITEALAYQTAKAVAEMRVAVETPVDRIIITGGMANFRFVTEYIKKKVSFLAPVEIMPGEYEMDALAEGAFDVLSGKETAKVYDILPTGFKTEESFYQFVHESLLK